MNFAFDEEQLSLGDTVARQLADHPELLAPDLSPDAGLPAWQSLAELGFFALLVPESAGGVGLAAIDLAPAVEAMGAALAPPAAADTLAVTDLLVHFGTPAQQEAWFARIAAGGLRIAIAAIEAGQDYTPEGFAARVSQGRLSGRKVVVAEAARADLFAVIAQSGSGPAVFLVPANAPGVSVRAHDDIDPTSALGEVTFADVALGPDALVGPAAPARAAGRLMDGAATLAAGLLTGIAGKMLAMAVEYAKTRTQFGQPIGAFQSIKHRCADMAVALEGARSATYYAFWSFSENSADRPRAVSMAKAYASEVARTVCNETIQVHGGMGFTWELGLHRFLRRAKVLEHAFGSATWHNERIVTETVRMLQASEATRSQAA